MANMTPCQALPGLVLYTEAKENGIALPDSYAGYGFLSYENQPLPTKCALRQKFFALGTMRGRSISQSGHSRAR